MKKLCDRLASERKALVELKDRLGKCSLSGHQDGISLNINGLGTIPLSEMDHYYAQRLIRGREIIMLGVKKTLGAMIDAQQKRVAELEASIAAARVTP